MTDEEAEEFLRASILSPNVMSWGVVDKNNLTNYRHPAPLVGFISFEFNGPYNGYFHVASPRSAWGKGLIDEAARAVIKQAFTDSEILRASAVILDNNRPAKSLCYRLGFKRDGVFEDFVRKNGQPMAVVHFGLTRVRWNEQMAPATEQAPVTEQEE